MKFCGEIAYDNDKNESVHSDICYRCNFPEDNGEPVSDTQRKYLHDSLDEWLNKGKGTGIFWLGDSRYFDDGFIGTNIKVVD
jgi:hypothetical protein